jgi:hypothetical protein
MSAAATAAGYLYAHDRLPAAGQPAAGHNSRPVAEERPQRAAESQPVIEPRTPRIEYRKRRLYALPAPA